MMKSLEGRFSESPFAPDEANAQVRVGRESLGALQQKWHCRARACVGFYVSHNTKPRRKVRLGSGEKMFCTVSPEASLPWIT